MKEIKLTKNGDFIEVDIEKDEEIKIPKFMQIKKAKDANELQLIKENKVRKAKLRKTIVKIYYTIGSLFAALGVAGFALAFVFLLFFDIPSLIITTSIASPILAWTGMTMRDEAKKYM